MKWVLSEVGATTAPPLDQVSGLDFALGVVGVDVVAALPEGGEAVVVDLADGWIEVALAQQLVPA